MLYRLNFLLVVFFLSACTKEAVLIDNHGPSKVKEVQMKLIADDYSLSGWMGLLADTVKLSGLSIPGTHDSGARIEIVAGTARCQYLTISEQLNAGTRFLDVRCRQIGDVFAIHHGNIYQKLFFGSLLNDVYSFLNKHPLETVIMSVKEESDPVDNKLSFGEVLSKYVNIHPGKWYVGNRLPELGQVRGRIVLISRFDSNEKRLGIQCNWRSNDISSMMDQHNPGMFVQDLYVVKSNQEKWSNILKVFNKAKSDDLSQLYINFCSGYRPMIFGIPNISYVADFMNAELLKYFSTSSCGRYGIIPMDFATAKQNRLIINTNLCDPFHPAVDSISGR